MKAESKTYQLAGYGLYYRSNNRLIKNANDRVLFQLLIDLMRNKIKRGDTLEITQDRKKLCQWAGLGDEHTGPASFKRLESLGLIKINSTKSIFVNCDAYVTAILYYESLSEEAKQSFASVFQKDGVAALKRFNVQIQCGCGSLLAEMYGSSFLKQYPEQTTEKLQSELKNFSRNCNSSVQECGETTEKLQSQLKKLAVQLKNFSRNCNSSVIKELMATEFFQLPCYSDFKNAFETGEIDSEVVLDPDFELKFFSWATEIFQFISQKTTEIFQYSNNIYNKKKNKEGATINNEAQTEEENEDYQEEIKKGFEGFGKVEIIDLDKPSEEIKEDFMETEDVSQQTLKRAERQLRERNSYRKKPFIKVERIKDIVDCLDEVVKSPVDFFLNQFWWGVFDLYCDHYHPSTRIDEEGEIEDEPQMSDWKEMIGAALPQDEIYALAKNVYDDMLGAVEQGRYVYGDNNEWEVKFAFSSFEDFNPYEIFQWSPCTMQDREIPALKVAIDKFYDIEAADIDIPKSSDRRTRNTQNKKLIELILSGDNSSLSPMEQSIKLFYDDFVVKGDDNVINEFTDGKGTVLESGGRLPDHLFKPWCYNLSSVRYNEFTEALNGKYRPCDGVHKKAFIFSAEKVAEWNEKNGYTNSLALQALQE